MLGKHTCFWRRSHGWVGRLQVAELLHPPLTQRRLKQAVTCYQNRDAPPPNTHNVVYGINCSDVGRGLMQVASALGGYPTLDINH
jgi:hypothetical protein